MLDALYRGGLGYLALRTLATIWMMNWGVRGYFGGWHHSTRSRRHAPRMMRRLSRVRATAAFICSLPARVRARYSNTGQRAAETPFYVRYGFFRRVA